MEWKIGTSYSDNTNNYLSSDNTIDKDADVYIKQCKENNNKITEVSWFDIDIKAGLLSKPNNYFYLDDSKNNYKYTFSFLYTFNDELKEYNIKEPTQLNVDLNQDEIHLYRMGYMDLSRNNKKSEMINTGSVIIYKTEYKTGFKGIFDEKQDKKDIAIKMEIRKNDSGIYTPYFKIDILFNNLFKKLNKLNYVETVVKCITDDPDIKNKEQSFRIDRQEENYWLLQHLDFYR